MSKQHNMTFWALLVVTAVWCVAMPFFWAYNLWQRLDTALAPYPQILSLYLPDLMTGGMFLLCLPLIFLRPRIAVAGLTFAALLLPTLHYALSTAAGAWPLGTTLLLLLGWRVYARQAR